MRPDFAIISEQGLRSYMEDYHFLDLNFGGKNLIFGGVYDGHGGKKAAAYAVLNLHKRFLTCLPALGPAGAFIVTYQSVSDEIKGKHIGTSATNFFIQNGRIYFANAGDSRIIVVGRKERQLTTDHRLTSDVEKKRIREAGGVINTFYIWRGEFGLMPTRSLGDHYFKPVGVIAIPSVGSYKILRTDRFLIAGTDGLFDTMQNREIGKLVRQRVKAKEIARALKEEILVKRRGQDNLTIIVLSLRADQKMH